MAAAQPVIMLATTHLLPEDLHPDLLRYVSGRGPLPSAQQGSPDAIQLPPQQALRNVILLEQSLPMAEPGLARLHPTFNLGIAAQTLWTLAALVTC